MILAAGGVQGRGRLFCHRMAEDHLHERVFDWFAFAKVGGMRWHGLRIVFYSRVLVQVQLQRDGLRTDVHPFPRYRCSIAVSQQTMVSTE